MAGHRLGALAYAPPTLPMHPWVGGSVMTRCPQAANWWPKAPVAGGGGGGAGLRNPRRLGGPQEREGLGSKALSHDVAAGSQWTKLCSGRLWRLWTPAGGAFGNALWPEASAGALGGGGGALRGLGPVEPAPSVAQAQSTRPLSPHTP